MLPGLVTDEGLGRNTLPNLPDQLIEAPDEFNQNIEDAKGACLVKMLSRGKFLQALS